MGVNRKNIVPLNQVIINKESDFPAPVSGKIPLADNTLYKIGVTQLLMVNAIDINLIQGSTTIEGTDGVLIYIGSGPFINGASGYTGIFSMRDTLIFGNAGATLYDIDGDGSDENVLSFRVVVPAFFGGLGSIKNLGSIFFDPARHGDNGTGIQIENIKVVEILNSPMENIAVASSDAPFFSFIGNFERIRVVGTSLQLKVGESFLYFSPTINITTGVAVEGTTFNAVAGTTFFDQQRTGVITAFADNGSGGTTVTVSVAHGLSIQAVTIAGTTNYNGTFAVSNATPAGTTFDIPVAFVADDATGTFDTGISSDYLDDNQFCFVANGDQIDTNEIGEMSVNAPFAVTIGMVDTPVKANGSNWSSNIERRFTFATSELTYTGPKTILMIVGGTITLDSVAGNDQLSAYIAINDVIVPESRVTALAGTPTTFSPSGVATISPGDVVALFVENNTDASNVNVEFGNLRISKA